MTTKRVSTKNGHAKKGAENPEIRRAAQRMNGDADRNVTIDRGDLEGVIAELRQATDKALDILMDRSDETTLEVALVLRNIHSARDILVRAAEGGAS